MRGVGVAIQDYGARSYVAVPAARKTDAR